MAMPKRASISRGALNSAASSRSRAATRGSGSVSRVVQWKLVPSLEALHANLAGALYKAGRFDEAIAASRRGLERFPLSEALLSALAAAAASVGQIEIARCV